MTSDSFSKLTARDKILLHLRDYWQYRERTEFPEAATQKGISRFTGLQITHIPRALKGLLSEKLLDEVKGHVQGEGRRYKAYFLTERGLAEANILLDKLKDIKVMVNGAEKTVGEVLRVEKDAGKFLALMKLLGEETSDIARPPKIIGQMPDTSDFVGRQAELAHMDELMCAPNSKVIVIYGSQGFGKSSLAAKFVRDKCRKWSVCWVEIKKGHKELAASLARALNELGLEDMEGKRFEDPQELVQALDGTDTIIVLDGYFDVSENVVEFFNCLVADSKKTEGFKLIITAREDTPSYNRFYTILDIHDGTVGEVHIRGLDMEHCKDVLGTPDIEPDALKKLYLFTMGCPTTLKLLASGNEKEMRARTKFTPEEIKLMMFLKEQKK